LGASLARYLGADFDLLAFLLGFLWLAFLLSAANLLDAAYRNPAEPYLPDQTPRQRDEYRRRLVLLCPGLAYPGGGPDRPALRPATGRPACPGLPGPGGPDGPGCMLCRLCALQIVDWANLPWQSWLQPCPGPGVQPANRRTAPLLPAYFFPLGFLALACFLALDFPTFAADQKYARQTLLIRLGWQAAIPAHNGFLAAAYLLCRHALSLACPSTWPGRPADHAPGRLPGLPVPPHGRRRKAYLAAADRHCHRPLGLTTYLLTLTLWLR
jgi:hypothetical protein